MAVFASGSIATTTQGTNTMIPSSANFTVNLADPVNLNATKGAVTVYPTMGAYF
jgi:hypothetical protein